MERPDRDGKRGHCDIWGCLLHSFQERGVLSNVFFGRVRRQLRFGHYANCLVYRVDASIVGVRSRQLNIGERWNLELVLVAVFLGCFKPIRSSSSRIF